MEGPFNSGRVFPFAGIQGEDEHRLGLYLHCGARRVPKKVRDLLSFLQL
jgi:hypothetical protein